MQPWAYVILHEGKNVENRPKTTHYRGTIAIHASQTMYQEDFDALKKELGIRLDPYSDRIAAMAVVGFADIVDVVTKETVTQKTKKWFQGKYGYVLSNVVPLREPVEVKGALGFWRLNGKSLKSCLDQLSGAQIKKFKEFKKTRN